MPINKKQAERLLEKKEAKLIDVRSPVDFARETLPNAVNIPLRNISQLMSEDRSRPIIFFGSSDDDQDLRQSENYAIQMGFSTVRSLGSIKNW